MELGLVRRRRTLRRLALALLAYGVAGLILLGLVSTVAARSFGSIAPLSGSLETERQGLVATLRATARGLGDSETASADVATSLEQARGSAARAASLADQMGTTMDGLAAASGVDVFGAHPLGGLGNGFTSAASESRDLGASLREVAASLDRDSSDLGRSQGELEAIRSQVNALADEVAAMPPFADTAAGTDALRWAFLALLAWLAVPSVAAIAAGAWLLRSTGGAGAARSA